METIVHDCKGQFGAKLYVLDSAFPCEFFEVCNAPPWQVDFGTLGFVHHRSIRDVKLSLLHSSNGAFLQAQMHSQYLWSLSYRPYGTSGFHEDKVRALEIMMSREQPESFTLFQDVWENIRQDLGMPDTATMFEVWQRLPTAGGFTSKGTLPKLGRWFSWNQAYEEQRDSWNILKLVLQYQYVDSELDPDTAAQKRELDALAELGD